MRSPKSHAHSLPRNAQIRNYRTFEAEKIQKNHAHCFSASKKMTNHYKPDYLKSDGICIFTPNWSGFVKFVKNSRRARKLIVHSLKISVCVQRDTCNYQETTHCLLRLGRKSYTATQRTGALENASLVELGKKRTASIASNRRCPSVATGPGPRSLSAAAVHQKSSSTLDERAFTYRVGSASRALRSS